MPQEPPIEYRGYLLVCKPEEFDEPGGLGKIMPWVVRYPDGSDVRLPVLKGRVMRFLTAAQAKRFVDVLKYFRAEGLELDPSAVALRWVEMGGLDDGPDRSLINNS